VTATLRDDLGQPLPDRPVEVQVREPGGRSLGTRRASTDTAGAARVTFPLETGRYEIVARWLGDDGYDAVHVQQPIDLDLAYVRLAVVVGGGGRLDLDEPSHEVEVRASSAEGGAGLTVEVRDELDRELARATTDARGTARIAIASETLGPPAAGRLVVRTPGDARRARAQTEVPIVRFRTTHLELEAAAERIVRGERVSVSGRLFDSQGPIPRRAVGLFADGAHVATLLTDDEGRFARELELDADDGVVEVSARFASDAPWRTSASSAPVAIAIEGAGSTPWPWLAAPMIACALALGLLGRRARRAAPERPRREPSIAPPGIAPARAATLGAQQRDVAGRVLDADEGTPIASATVRLREVSLASEVRAETDAEGRFALARLEGEAWTIEVTAPGYERITGSVRVPHRGQWSAMTVRLRSLRELALRKYRPVAEALAPQPQWWAFWTPHELAGRASARARAEVEALTARVEEAVYAAPHPREEDVAEIGERAARAVRALDER
ncbi:MAG TPA: carboxypeptidase regulatory-like domain-containing protein, partial [Sandaracinaceae bacterium]